MQIKTILSILMIAGCCLVADADKIIYRDGTVEDAKIVQVRDSKIIYMDPRVASKKLEMPTTELYMISIEEVGNIYFDEQGERRAGETKPANPSKVDIIYLVSGMEIPCENAMVNGDFVNFKVKDTNGFKGIKGIFGLNKKKDSNLPREDVFMICYRNGLNDILTPLLTVEEDKAEEDNPASNSYDVTFHEYKSGEKLEEIAAQYNVEVEQIAEWNDLNKSRGKYIVTPGTQLMIYLSKQ